MRVIIRFSIDNDHGDLSSKLKSILKRNHLKKQRGTGTYEGSDPDVNIDSLKVALDEFLDKIKEQKEAKLDHFWMYVDKGTSEPRKGQNDSNQRKNKQ
jgi:hypothetical protein